MKLKYPYLMILTIAFFGCNPGTSEEDTEERAEELNDAAKTDWAEEDAEFIVEAYSFNLMIQEYARVAADKQSTPAPIKEYAQEALSYYANLNRELMEIAKANNVVLPEAVGENILEHKEELIEEEGAEFAEDFIDTIDDIHRKMIGEYTEANVQSIDESLRTWVSVNLPNIEAREEMVDELRNYADEID